MIYTRDIIGYQWDVFIKALALGVLLGGCFDIFRAVKIILRFGKKLSAAADILFCLWSGFLIFSFLLNENYGVPRLYIFIGAGGGFFVWYFTVGRITPKISKFIGRLIRAVLSPFFKIFRKILKIVKKRTAKAKIIVLNLFDKGKKLLKKKAGLVYNILCLNISKAFSFCGGKAGKEPEELESNGTEKTEEGSFYQDRSYCLRSISPLFADIHPGGDQQKTDGT